MSTADNDTRASAPEPSTADGSAARPRTRWAAIIWGAFFAALALGALWMFARPEGRRDLSDWIMSLTPGAVTAYSLLAVGALVLVVGLVGLVRRAQRRFTPAPARTPDPAGDDQHPL